tara:strand:- start:2312 stop:3232 length:921 start_codon:yes stop_codon:yes gene_type:complete
MFFAALCLWLLSASFAHAQLSSPVPLSGYAWSSTIGWVSFSGPGYGVDIETNGDLDGYAWSSTIGWIKFGGLSSFPSGGSDANLDISTNEATGWARACAGTEFGDCSTMADHPGGWDGWISLNCSNTGGCGTSSYVVGAGGGVLTGYAWGSSVIGWLDVSNVTFTAPCSPGFQCLADLSGYEQTDQWCQVVNTTNCSSPLICDTGNPGSCVANTLAGSISVRPAAARSGDTTEITWSSTDAISCTVEQQNAAGNASQSWTGLSGTETSDPVNQFTIFSLMCTNAGGIPEYEVASTSMDIIPLNIET